MSKILLINSPFNIIKASYDTSVSVGLLSIASYLHNKGKEVVLIDGARQPDYLKLIEDNLADSDIVGLSVMTTQIGPALSISKFIKDKKPSVKIVWGGVHATLFPEATVSHPLIDIVVMNEGEETLLEVIESRRPLNDILGIAFKKDGEVQINPKRPFLKMEEIPLPNWSLVNENVLRRLTLIPTHTSRGCPFQCAFCVNSITCNVWRGYDAETVLKGVEEIKKKDWAKGKPLRFWDENFFTDINRSRAILNGMIDRGLVNPWETTVRVDSVKDNAINDAFLSLLKKSGCYLLSYGGESGSERILKKINKGTSPEQIIFSAKQTIRHGIIPQYSFMVGVPGETKKDIFETINLIDKLTKLHSKVQILGPQAFRPYPGSKLYDDCLATGWSGPQTLEGWAKASQDQLNFLSPKDFPWTQDNLDLIESLEAYVRFGAHSIKSALGSSVKSNKLLKLGFILLCQLRWKLKFFKWPIEFKIARKSITKV